MENRWTRRIYSASPVLAQHLYCSAVGWQNRRRRFGRQFWDRLRFLESTEWSSAQEFANLQDEELGKLVRHSFDTVPYYRALFDQMRLQPADVRTRSDLLKLPVLSKETVRHESARLVSTAYHPREIYHGHTSGTTGTALPLAHCDEGLANENATNWRMRRRYGVDVYGSNATFQARLTVPIEQRDPPFWRYNVVERQTLFSIYHTAEQHLAASVARLARGDFDYYRGYPSFLYTVATFVQERGFDLSTPPKAVFPSSESLLPHHRATIEAAFRAPVRDRYGNSEFAASMIECDNGNLHIDMEFGIVEIDPIEETDTSVRGRMLCTSFANPVMPLIRYDIGDVATVLKQPCSCGRQSTAVSSVEGRIEDYVVTPDGRRVGRMDHLFKDMLTIKECQIIQPSLDKLLVKIVPRPSYTSADEAILLRDFRGRLGDGLDIQVVHVDQIPRDRSGKFRAVVSHVNGTQFQPRQHQPEKDV